MVPEPLKDLQDLLREQGPAGKGGVGPAPPAVLARAPGESAGPSRRWDPGHAGPSGEKPASPQEARRSSSAPASGSTLPVVEPAVLARLYANRQYEQLTEIFCRVLAFHAQHTYTEMTPALQAQLDAFVESLFYYLTKPDYRPSPEGMCRLMTHYHVLANLVAMSSMRNTDAPLRILLRQGNCFGKLMLLYSPRNTVVIDPKAFFDVNARLASEWYVMYQLAVPGGASPVVYENLRRHYASIDERFTVADERVTHMYFGCTYVAPDYHHLVKARINQNLQRQLGALRLYDTPQRDRIAIVTGKWFPASAVYRSSFPLIATLKQHYRLTLVHLGPENPGLDASLFDDVRHVRIAGNDLSLSCLVGNDFQLAYFTDVGMLPESIWLSNVRVAPIQVVSYGHPVSTYGSRIDYFLGGLETETLAEAQKHYSERLVLIPGLGAHPVYPDYQRQYPAPRNDGQTLVNCSWGCTKVNYPMLMNLKRIRQRASKPVRFQFFPNWSLERYNQVIPFLQDIGEVLGGDGAEVISNRLYHEYMLCMERADLSLDSYPFGGYNTIVDSLYLGKPIVSYEGWTFYNRAASGLLRKLGLEELVARNNEEYVEKTVRLINDDEYRRALVQRIEQMDLKARIFESDEPGYFCQAIDFLIANHDALQRDGTRTPIVIG